MSTRADHERAIEATAGAWEASSRLGPEADSIAVGQRVNPEDQRIA